MAWPQDLIVLANWALQHEDLRHRFLRATSASTILHTSGIDAALEVSVVLRIYEAAVAKGYVYKQSVDYERRYHPVSLVGIAKKKNPKRVDLAFKDSGVGKNWGYVEVKYYSAGGVKNDIRKLLAYPHRVQRWMLAYRVSAIQATPQPGAPVQSLPTLMASALSAINVGCSWQPFPLTAAFSTIDNRGAPAMCEIFLGRLVLHRESRRFNLSSGADIALPHVWLNHEIPYCGAVHEPQFACPFTTVGVLPWIREATPYRI